MLLTDKIGVIFGVANKRSIAWACAQACAAQGAKLAFTYQADRLKENVEDLAATLGVAGLVDVAKRRPFRLRRRANGFADTFGKVVLPDFSGMVVYLVMAAVLLWRPEGILKKG